MELLQARDISYSFKQTSLLKDVHLSLKTGRVYSLVGSNGAGKTTLLNVIGGYLKPYTGRIYFKRKLINSLPPQSRALNGIIRLWQGSRVFKNLSVLDNLLTVNAHPGENLLNYIFHLTKVNVFETFNRKKAEEILFHLGLTEKSNLLADELSIGEERLLAFGRILMNNRIQQGNQLILLDEPFTGVNDHKIDFIGNMILQFAKSGNAVLIVEHNVKKVFKISHEVIVMHDGSIFKVGHPDEILRNESVREIYLGI